MSNNNLIENLSAQFDQSQGSKSSLDLPMVKPEEANKTSNKLRKVIDVKFSETLGF